MYLTWKMKEKIDFAYKQDCQHLFKMFITY